MEIRHADLQIEVEDAEDGGVLLTIIDSARLSLSLPRKTATELLDAIDACMKTGERQTTDSVDVWRTADDLPLKPTLGVMDVSFISITKILPAAAAIMGEDGEFISLIKPQFEAGRDRVGKKGVVRDAQVHLDVVKEILQFIDADMGWTAQNLSFSPIKGPEGNIEFLVHILPKCRATHCVTEQEAAEVVRQAHESLGNA